jgi:hypothetical protein
VKSVSQKYFQRYHLSEHSGEDGTFTKEAAMVPAIKEKLQSDPSTLNSALHSLAEKARFNGTVFDHNPLALTHARRVAEEAQPALVIGLAECVLKPN